MFYPGQPVYIPEEKRLAIYLGFGNYTKYPYEKYMYVLVLQGEDGSESELNYFDVNKVEPLVKADKKSVTGQRVYFSHFQKDSISKTYSEKEATDLNSTFLEELLKLSRAKWVKGTYEIDLKPSKNNEDN